MYDIFSHILFVYLQNGTNECSGGKPVEQRQPLTFFFNQPKEMSELSSHLKRNVKFNYQNKFIIKMGLITTFDEHLQLLSYCKSTLLTI